MHLVGLVQSTQIASLLKELSAHKLHLPKKLITTHTSKILAFKKFEGIFNMNKNEEKSYLNALNCCYKSTTFFFFLKMTYHEKDR